MSNNEKPNISELYEKLHPKVVTFSESLHGLTIYEANAVIAFTYANIMSQIPSGPMRMVAQLDFLAMCTSAMEIIKNATEQQARRN